MMNLFALLLGAIWRVFRARRELLLENLPLRQQLMVVVRQNSSRDQKRDRFWWRRPESDPRFHTARRL